MGKDQSLSPAGTWYGGSSDAKYQYCFIPGDGGRYFLTCSGGYSPSVFDAKILTPFTGELEKKADNDYEIRLMALSRKDPADPNELPTMIAARGVVRIAERDKMTVTWTHAGYYAWDTAPFIDEPLSWIVTKDEPVVEYLNRMLMGTKLS